MFDTNDSVVALKDAQLSTDLGGEHVILSLVDEVYYGLDGVGSRVWELLQSPTTFGDLVETICRDYDVSREECARDIDSLLHDLQSRSLVSIASHTGP